MRSRARSHADEAGAPARSRVETSAVRRASSRVEGGPCARPRWWAASPRRVEEAQCERTAQRDRAAKRARGRGDVPPRPEVRPETSPEVRPEARPETSPEARPEARPETSPEARPEARPETSPEARSGAHSGARPEARTGAPREPAQARTTRRSRRARRSRARILAAIRAAHTASATATRTQSRRWLPAPAARLTGARPSPTGPPATHSPLDGGRTRAASRHGRRAPSPAGIPADAIHTHLIAPPVRLGRPRPRA